MTPLHAIYRDLAASADFQAYRERHGIESADVLSVLNEGVAERIATRLAPIIGGKVVVEIGAGTGLLGITLGRYATRVFCIEANPYWGFMFAENLVREKPRNVSFLLGAAAEFEGIVRGDVALFCSHTAVAHLTAAGRKFASRVVDVYGELFGRDAARVERAISELKAVCA